MVVHVTVVHVTDDKTWMTVTVIYVDSNDCSVNDCKGDSPFSHINTVNHFTVIWDNEQK